MQNFEISYVVRYVFGIACVLLKYTPKYFTSNTQKGGNGTQM